MNSSNGSMMTIPIIVIILCIIFYAYMIHITMNDTMNHTCNAGWWLKLLAILNLIVYTIYLLMLLKAAYESKKMSF